MNKKTVWGNRIRRFFIWFKAILVTLMGRQSNGPLPAVKHRKYTQWNQVSNTIHHLILSIPMPKSRPVCSRIESLDLEFKFWSPHCSPNLEPSRQPNARVRQPLLIAKFAPLHPVQMRDPFTQSFVNAFKCYSIASKLCTIGRSIGRSPYYPVDTIQHQGPLHVSQSEFRIQCSRSKTVAFDVWTQGKLKIDADDEDALWPEKVKIREIADEAGELRWKAILFRKLLTSSFCWTVSRDWLSILVCGTSKKSVSWWGDARL